LRHFAFANRKSEGAVMGRRYFRLLSRRKKSLLSLLTAITLLLSGWAPALAMNSQRNGSLPQPLPLFPSDNWWNRDISNWPVDPNSASFIDFINNGGTRRLHPDLGGDAGTTSDPNAIYGIPYAVVTNIAPGDLKAVEFLYWDESDGVDLNTGVSFPFYPIPPEAITQAKWIEGGDPGNVDRRASQDRHFLIVDQDRNHLYELYNVYHHPAQKKWYAGSGAFFDMNTNDRRPETWTSADAAGLAVLPGLLRYDEVSDPNVTEIQHAFRVTVRSTNGYVFPASHRAGSTPGAVPMGARLRLKSSVDVTQKTSDPNVQKIFRAMQKYGLIVADNGSDMYITGTYDTRWNNGVLNPAFANLTASDFEVIQLGYNPPAVGATTLGSLSVNPTAVTGGQPATGTVTLTGPAPAGGAVVSLSSANPAATVPASVTVPANLTVANFTINSLAVAAPTAGNITASFSGVNKSTTITVNPAIPVILSSVTLTPSVIAGGSTSVGTVSLTVPAPTGGVAIGILSNKPSKATVPASVVVPAGSASASFDITTTSVKWKTIVTITASHAGLKKSAKLTLKR
jgi:hypothetical protein